MTFHDDPTKGWPGGQWILSASDRVESLWGTEREVAWPKGEAFIIVGGDGSGKTALAGNLLMRQAGIITDPLLGMQVEPRERVLYLAQDRPEQARRSLKRLIGGVDRGPLDERLSVIDWPIGLIDEQPEMIAQLALEHGADTVYVDSLKDVVVEPSGETSGLAVKRAYSEAISKGVEVCLLHHDRKAGQDSRRKILKLSDVYGSRFITAGAGSVLALNGGSGDPVIDLRQLKQPDEEVGPHQVRFNFNTGEMELSHGTDIVGLVTGSPKGLPALDVARIIYETDKPTRSDKERARRKLQSLVDKGLIAVRKGVERNEPDHYTPVAVIEPTQQTLDNKVHGGVHAEVF
jgi:replicative DNA helicase